MKWDMQTALWERVATGVALLFLLLFSYHTLDASQAWKDFFETSMLPFMEEPQIDESTLSSLTSQFEGAIQEAIPMKLSWIEFHGVLQDVQQKKVIPDLNYGSLYKTSDGQISFGSPRLEVEEDAHTLSEVSQQLESLSIPFLYVQAPYKLAPDQNQLPYQIKEYGNDNADRLLTALQEEQVPIYDMREGYFHAGMSQSELFFNTDHHWTIPGALMATRLLAQEINQYLDSDIDSTLFTEESFQFEVFEDFFLGSLGKRVGVSYSGLADFTVVTPKFDTEFTVSIFNYGAWSTKEGSFSDAILVSDFLDPNLPVETNRYAAYNGDHEIIRIQNHEVKGKKILMIKDSYGLPIYSFLACGVEEVTALDLRLYRQSVIDFAKEYQPDIVLYLFNADAVGRGSFK
mgnify:CR=1 FL=1